MPPFHQSRKRAISTPPNDSCSSSTAISNEGGAHIKSNKTSQHKKQCTQQSTHAVNSKANLEYRGVSNNRQQLDTNPDDGDSEPLYISSILLQLLSEDKVIKLADYVEITAHEPFLKQQDEYDIGHGQRYYTDACSAAYKALEKYYARLGDDRGLAELQEDVDSCFNKVSINFDTDEDESVAADEGDNNYTKQNDDEDFRFDSGGGEGGFGELRTGIPADGAPLKFDRAPNGVKSGKASTDAIAGGDGDTQDAAGISFDISSNESINGDRFGTTPTDASHTNTSPTIDEEADNAPPSLDSIKCVERVDNKRNDPSPTNVITANLSSFTNDTSSNKSDHDEGEHDLPSFGRSLATCVGESIEVAPKKGKAYICFVCCFFII